MHYSANLFRGWEIVHLRYDLDDSAITMRRKRTWKPLETQRVEIASLTGGVRRIRARQPANIFATALLVVVLLILGIDATMHGVGAKGDGVSWPLWGPLLGVGGLLWMVRYKTRIPAEWSHFVGTAKGGGLFILRDGRHAHAHEKFVAAIRQRLPSH